MIISHEIAHTFLIEKLIKDTSSFDMYEVEFINSLQVYTKDKQKVILNKEIDKFVEQLNRSYAFVAYHFENKIFMEEDYLKDPFFIYMDDICNELNQFHTEEEKINRLNDIFSGFDNFSVEPNKEESNKIAKGYYNIKKEYRDSKRLELLLKKRDSLDNNLAIKTSEIVDFSDSKATEKIIMLEKLGLIDFLRTKEPFNISTNKLATAISGITGINTSTVQSYINPMISKNTNQKNNPLNSTKTVGKVDQKLISIGFKPFN
jgi:hypothetical protein